MKINTSPNNSTTYQHAHSHADYFWISVYVFNGSLNPIYNIFLYDLCYYMVFSLGNLPSNIYIFTTHGLSQASNIDTLLTYDLPPGSTFSNNVVIPPSSVVAIHKPYFFPIGIWIPTKHSTCIPGNTTTKCIPHHHHDKEISTIPLRFLHLFFSIFLCWRALVKIHYTGNLITSQKN